MKQIKEFFKKHKDDIIIVAGILGITAVTVASIIVLSKHDKEGKLILDVLKTPYKNGFLTKEEVFKLINEIGDNAKYAIFKENIGDSFAFVEL